MLPGTDLYICFIKTMKHVQQKETQRLCILSAQVKVGNNKLGLS